MNEKSKFITRGVNVFLTNLSGLDVEKVTYVTNSKGRIHSGFGKTTDGRTISLTSIIKYCGAIYDAGYSDHDDVDLFILITGLGMLDSILDAIKGKIPMEVFVIFLSRIQDPDSKIIEAFSYMADQYGDVADDENEPEEKDDEDSIEKWIKESHIPDHMEFTKRIDEAFKEINDKLGF